MIDFSVRSATAELMDAPDIPTAELYRTLDELTVINTTLGGYRPSLLGIRQLLPRQARQLRLLDVGTGGGDLPRKLLAWATRRGIDARVLGVDLLPSAIDYAREKSAGSTQLEFESVDVHDLDDGDRFDIAHTALTLHHFDNEHAPTLLAKMYALSRWGIIVNDLHRHPVAYCSIRTLTTLLSRSRLIKNDAPLSVLRAFRKHELMALVEAAGLPLPEISWHWAFRWLVVIRKPDTKPPTEQIKSVPMDRES